LFYLVFNFCTKK